VEFPFLKEIHCQTKFFHPHILVRESLNINGGNIQTVVEI